ncbi:MAG: glycosyltransferase family 4 protein [Rhodospirillales bacterium]|nr:glycosyltransferase family 4 protein [Acetobacter sp.]
MSTLTARKSARDAVLHDVPLPHDAELKVAIVHDWLPVRAGAERVLEEIINVFPQADLFAMIDLIPEEQRGFLRHKKVITSFVQGLPAWLRSRYRAFLPLMACAVEQFDLGKYDLIISSSYAVAKGVLTGPTQLHVCYCHSPMRYAWDLQHQYLRESNITSSYKGLIARIILHYLRIWDGVNQQRVDHFITNSRFVQKRIAKFYRREAAVVYPPVDAERFALSKKKGDYYLTASRLVPYKMIGMIVDAFAKMPDRELRVVGNGPEFKNIFKRATPNVKMLSYQPDDVLVREMQGAKAFIFAAEEDFGILPVEAQACGTPVIAYGRGGARETVIPGQTGLFFHEQTAESLCACVGDFESGRHHFDPQTIRTHAEKFSSHIFRTRFEQEVNRRWQQFVNRADASL